jgi:hypothetical protein
LQTPATVVALPGALTLRIIGALAAISFVEYLWLLRLFQNSARWNAAAI